MNSRDRLGGIIHTYQKFDPVHFPSPTAPPPDLVSPAFEHLLFYGNTRRLTPEELARAVHIDPRQIRGLGPSLEALMEILRERKRKISISASRLGPRPRICRGSMWTARASSSGVS